MPDIEFDDDGRVEFLTLHHGLVTLERAKWELICKQPERHYYRLNGEKVATALIAPDVVRHHATMASQFLYYKRFPRWQFIPGVEVPATRAMMMTVVVDTNGQRVRTVYPVSEPKQGREYRP